MAKLTPSQQQRALIRDGLLRAGYAAMLDSENSARPGSLRPAIEAYLEYHGRKSDTPLEDLVTLLERPRHCNRPDVDYTVHGEPMATGGVQPPAARTIERFLSGDIDPTAAGRGVTFWTHDRIRTRWKFDRISVGTDANMLRVLRVWSNICGIRFDAPTAGQPNIDVFEARLGMGILGMAQLPGRGASEQTQLWHKISLGHNWNVELFNTTVWHEYGHGFGSGHIRGGLMNPSHIPGLGSPQPKDIAWAQQHYPLRGDEDPSDISLVQWSDTPAPGPTPGPTPPVPDIGPGEVFASTSCVIRLSPDGKTATMTGTFRKA